LSDGYPDTKKYIFDVEKADDIVDKLLHGGKLFLNPLIWNLRPGAFEAFWDDNSKQLYIYSGRIYLPDSHHRHQAIVKAINIWRTAKKEYPKFNGSKQFKIELYFLSREDEGNYFYAKNQLPKPTARSKAYDLTTVDDLSLLAKKVIELSPNLSENVNRVTDKLTSTNPQVITLSTLREMMRSFTSEDVVDQSELDGSAAIAAQFYDILAKVRPELGHLSVQERKQTRAHSLVDSAVMMHGYAALLRDFRDDLPKLGTSKARVEWTKKLDNLRADKHYCFDKWSGDLFEKTNPLWSVAGVTKPGKDQSRPTVLNTGAARSECGRILRQVVAMGPAAADLKALISR
jgi:hypothetical protein